MAFSWGDGFDLYATPADALAGYWDTGGSVSIYTLVPGRLGGQALSSSVGGSGLLIKSSGQNDTVHHLAVAFMTTFHSGTFLSAYLQLLDGTTAKVCVVFKSNGDILLTSGAPNGTVLATWTAGAPAVNTWYQYEFEIVIGAGTTGSFAARRDGATSNSFSATGIKTAPGTNAYANKLQAGVFSGYQTQVIDDLFWRSGATTGAWLGDLCCRVLSPAADASTQFARVSLSSTFAFGSYAIGANTYSGATIYTTFVAPATGLAVSGQLYVVIASTTRARAAIYDASHTDGYPGYSQSGLPGNPLAVSDQMALGNIQNTWVPVTFSSPAMLTKGKTYWLAVTQETGVIWGCAQAVEPNAIGTTPNYADFPITNPPYLYNQGANGSIFQLTFRGNTNALAAGEIPEDGPLSYVYDGAVGDQDFYSVAAVALPSTIVMTVLRAFVAKGGAGAARTAAAQLKSGATTVASPAATLTTTAFQWTWRADLTDPNTGAAWTAAALGAIQIGPKVVS